LEDGDALICEHEVVARIVRLRVDARCSREVDELLQPFPVERRELILAWVEELRALQANHEMTMPAVPRVRRRGTER